jgi:prepilin-type N-terminal cleavage/methylation domain-containing protein
MNLARKGFSLLELLVVIAIIGILAAIILPVYASAKNNAYRNADMSNMNQLRTALQLYRTDQGAYPPALLGYVTQYMGTMEDMVPANDFGQLYNGKVIGSALYPKRVGALSTFEPANDRNTSGNSYYSAVVDPVWPNGELGGVVNPGDCASGTATSAQCSMQRYGNTHPVGWCWYGDTGTANSAPDPAFYYQISGYDVASVRVPTLGTINELHYSLWWTGYTVPDQCNYQPSGGTEQPGVSDALGNGSDNPRQLGYSNPPESTVVTWDSWFRTYDGNNNVPHQRLDIVLFLAGDARPYDSANVASQAWQVTP